MFSGRFGQNYREPETSYERSDQDCHSDELQVGRRGLDCSYSCKLQPG